MKVLEKDGMQTGIEETKKEINTVKQQISQIRSAVKSLTSLEDSFKGKTAESIFSFYSLCHETFLKYMQEFLSDYSKALEEIGNDIDLYEPNPKGYIDEQFITQDVAKALEKLEEQTESLAKEANQIMMSVSDIVTLEQLKTWEFESAVEDAEKKGEDTVEKLLDLDHYKAMRLKEPEVKFAVMKDYITQIGKSMPNPAWSIPRFHFGDAVRMPAYSVMYKHVYKEELERIRLDRERQEREKTALGIAANRYVDTFTQLFVAKAAKDKAVEDFADDTVNGLKNTVLHPEETVQTLTYMFKHPRITAETVAQNFAESIKNNIINGNTATRTHWFTYAGLSVLGPKGISAGAKGASKAASVAGKEFEKATNAISEKVKGLNIGPQPALSGGYTQFDGSYKLPDNVNLKDQLMQSKAGEVPGSKGKLKGIDNASVTNKSNLYRGDSLLHSPTRPNGIGKPHISNSGDLVPASKDGLYKGRQVTVTEHILGGYRKGAKSNSPYTSFTNNKNVIGNYGENAIELDISALRKDIQSGKVKDVVILSPKQIQKLIERDVISSDFWKNRAINWTKRDNEYLIKGEVPSQYIKVSPKE